MKAATITVGGEKIEVELNSEGQVVNCGGALLWSICDCGWQGPYPYKKGCPKCGEPAEEMESWS